MKMLGGAAPPTTSRCSLRNPPPLLGPHLVRDDVVGGRRASDGVVVDIGVMPMAEPHQSQRLVVVGVVGVGFSRAADLAGQPSDEASVDRIADNRASRSPLRIKLALLLRDRACGCAPSLRLSPCTPRFRRPRVVAAALTHGVAVLCVPLLPVLLDLVRVLRGPCALPSTSARQAMPARAVWSELVNWVCLAAGCAGFRRLCGQAVSHVVGVTTCWRSVLIWGEPAGITREQAC